MDEKTGKIATFRYGLIVPLVAEVLPKGELTRRAEEIAARRYDIPPSKRTAVSVDTLLRWVCAIERVVSAPWRLKHDGTAGNRAPSLPSWPN